MTMIATDHLIRHYLELGSQTLESQRKTIINPITSYFNNHTPLTLQTLLLNHGLFQPDKNNHTNIKEWIEQDLWSFVHKQIKKLKDEWQGPDVNVFILPANLDQKTSSSSEQKLSGLSFSNQIVLFLTHQIEKVWIKALLAHEYSHSFRLKKSHQQKELITLADTLILEGIAEAITVEKYNISFLPKDKTNDETIKNQFNQWIKPNLSIQTNHPLHHYIMYGGNQFDQRMGYQIGAYLVQEWQANHQVNIPTLLRQPTKIFFQDLE